MSIQQIEMPFIKLYTKIIYSPTIRMLSKEDRWHFDAILCLKGSGVLDAPEKNLLRKRVALVLELDEEGLKRVAETLSGHGLIDAETLQPINWDVYQPTRQNSTPRVQKHRENKKNQESQQDSAHETHETHGNVTGNVTGNKCNAIEVEVEKEKEEREECLTDTEAKEKPVRSQGSRLSPDWVPSDEDIAFCKKMRSDLDVDITAEKFRCHWLSKTGKDATKLNWHLTWKKWVLSESRNFTPAKPSVPMDYV